MAFWFPVIETRCTDFSLLAFLADSSYADALFCCIGLFQPAFRVFLIEAGENKLLFSLLVLNSLTLSFTSDGGWSLNFFTSEDCLLWIEYWAWPIQGLAISSGVPPVTLYLEAAFNVEFKTGPIYWAMYFSVLKLPPTGLRFCLKCFYASWNTTPFSLTCFFTD